MLYLTIPSKPLMLIFSPQMVSYGTNERVITSFTLGDVLPRFR